MSEEDLEERIKNAEQLFITEEDEDSQDREDGEQGDSNDCEYPNNEESLQDFQG